MPEFVAPAFMRIRTGLLEAKHVKAMGGGSPLVVYLYLQARVRFRGEDAGVTWEPYTHAEAAKDLGLNPRSVEGWFQTLRSAGYIEVRKLQHGLEVRITKYGQEAPQTTPANVGTAPTRVRPGAESDKSRLRQPTGQTTPPKRQTTPANVGTDAPIKEARARSVENKRTREVSRSARPDLFLACDGYFAAIGRPKPKDGYGRAAKRFAELIDAGTAPTLIGRCTGYLLSKPFFEDHPPTPEQVRDAFPLWEQIGRPARWSAKHDSRPKAEPKGMDAYLEVLKLEGKLPDDYDPYRRTADTGAGGGARPGIREVRQSLPGESPHRGGTDGEEATLPRDVA